MDFIAVAIVALFFLFVLYGLTVESHAECKNKCAQSFALNTVPETEAIRIGLESETLI